MKDLTRYSRLNAFILFFIPAPKKITMDEKVCTNCNVPKCRFFPQYKKSLEGLCWHRAVHTLLLMKKENEKKYENMLNRLKYFSQFTKILFSFQCRYTVHDCNFQVDSEIIDKRYCIFSFKNKYISHLLKLIEIHDVTSIDFMVSNVEKIYGFTDNPYCPIHVTKKLRYIYRACTDLSYEKIILPFSKRQHFEM